MTDREFQEFISKAIDELGPMRIAIEFDVAASTVKRWENGVAKPHPILQKKIIRTLEGLMDVETD